MPVAVRTQGLRSIPVRVAEVRRRAERMLGAARESEAVLSVLLCDDVTMAELNGTYRGRDRPTDVLAFSMREGTHGELAGPLLGDVVISVDTARRQAREQGKTISEELSFLLAHGILHLLGYDHQTEAEERRMNALADGLRAAARGGRGRRRPGAGPG
jgi:probable rRNA maturation factor